MTVAFSSAFQPAYDASRMPALVVADDESARHRALSSVEAGGYVGRCLSAANAVQAINNSPSLGLVWVELDAMNQVAEALIRRLDQDSQGGRYAAVVATGTELIDPLTALVEGSEVELVIGRSEVDRTAALSLATMRTANARVRDNTSDESAARLRQLSEEVSRIAATLARLSGDGSAPSPLTGTEAPPVGDLPAIPADKVRAIIRARRERAKYLPADLFADPAWDMLLDLLQAELVQHRVPVSSLCIAAAVPATTALRWIKTMTDRGLLVRRPDPHDGRRVFMEMSRGTSHALRRFFKEVGLALV